MARTKSSRSTYREKGLWCVLKSNKLVDKELLIAGVTQKFLDEGFKPGPQLKNRVKALIQELVHSKCLLEVKGHNFKRYRLSTGEPVDTLRKILRRIKNNDEDETRGFTLFCKAIRLEPKALTVYTKPQLISTCNVLEDENQDLRDENTDLLDEKMEWMDAHLDLLDEKAEQDDVIRDLRRQVALLEGRADTQTHAQDDDTMSAGTTSGIDDDVFTGSQADVEMHGPDAMTGLDDSGPALPGAFPMERVLTASTPLRPTHLPGNPAACLPTPDSMSRLAPLAGASTSRSPPESPSPPSRASSVQQLLVQPQMQAMSAALATAPGLDEDVFTGAQLDVDMHGGPDGVTGLDDSGPALPGSFPMARVFSSGTPIRRSHSLGNPATYLPTPDSMFRRMPLTGLFMPRSPPESPSPPSRTSSIQQLLVQAARVVEQPQRLYRRSRTLIRDRARVKHDLEMRQKVHKLRKELKITREENKKIPLLQHALQAYKSARDLFLAYQVPDSTGLLPL